MADADRVTALAEAIADGRALDWDSAARDAADDDERGAVAALRELADIGEAFATLGGSPDRRRRRELLPRARSGDNCGSSSTPARAGSATCIAPGMPCWIATSP